MSGEEVWRREDRQAMRRALALARRGRSTTAPNPMVGAVVVRDGVVVGSGWHRRAGGAHAETLAFASAGDEASGATLFVTLEPCNHQGRTPPCVDGVIAAGVSRVVYAHRDPNPEVAGGGAERLLAAGIEVESGLLVEEAVELNVPFLTRALFRRPAVTLKWAMSLDGRIATAAGDSQWISSERGRRWALELREEHQAILVGSGTALADDPRLDRRLGRALEPILRAVLDRRLRLSPRARMFEIEGPVVVYTEQPAGDASAAETLASWARRRDALLDVGAEVAVVDRVTPGAVLRDLYARGIAHLLVEGGGEILSAFAGSGAWDRAAVCCAPLLIGGADAPGPLGGDGVKRLGDAWRLDRLRTYRRGPDVILVGYRQGCLPDLLRSVVG